VVEEEDKVEAPKPLKGEAARAVRVARAAKHINPTGQSTTPEDIPRSMGGKSMPVRVGVGQKPDPAEAIWQEVLDANKTADEEAK